MDGSAAGGGACDRQRTKHDECGTGPSLTSRKIAFIPRSNFFASDPITASNEAFMTINLMTGAFSQAMYGTAQASLLATAFDRFLGLELDESRMDAQGMGTFATQVAASISDHFKELSSALPPSERQNVERIAAANGLAARDATVEYLSNAYLFRAIRDYFDLPPQNVFPQLDAGGFLAFTWNGSIVASPPEEGWRRRTFHYTRMPSRTDAMETSSLSGELRRDVALGHRLKTTAFTTSPIQRLLYTPPNQTELFEAIRESSIAASVSVSMFVTRR